MKNYIALSVLASSILAINSYAASTLQSLDDDELAATTGQALLYMGTTNGTDVDSAFSDFKYYKMGFQADIEANLNIKTLQLGCGGVNGAGACDIDIENFSLTGVPTRIKADGTPQWNYSGKTTDGTASLDKLENERAASSMSLRNPFIEFAIKNPTNLAQREVAGFRLSAEGIKGYMTAGTHNDALGENKNQGGINTFSGYIITDPVGSEAMTQAATFGRTEDQKIYTPVYIYMPKSDGNSGIDVGLKARRTAYNNITKMNSTNPNDAPGTINGVNYSQWGIGIAPLSVAFDFPQTVVTGNRMSALNLKVDDVPINQIVVSAKDGPLFMQMDRSVYAGTIATWLGLEKEIKDAVFFMGKEGTRSLSVIDPESAAYAGLNSTQKAENLALAQKLYAQNAVTQGYTTTTENNNIRAAYDKLMADSNHNTKAEDLLIQKAAANHMGCVSGGSGSGISVAVSSCTTIDNLAANVAVKQNFTRMHNLPVATAKMSGTLNGQACSQEKPCYDYNQGFYLSLQKEALRWPGSSKAYILDPQTKQKTEVSDTYVGKYYVVDKNGNFARYGSDANQNIGEVQKQEFVNAGDIAQRGWWMSFSEPLNFGKLEVQKTIDMSDVLPQVATFINNFFSQQAVDGAGNPLYAISGEDKISGTGPNSTGRYPNYTPADGEVIFDYATTTNKNQGGIIGAVPKNQVILGPVSAAKAAKGLPLYVPLGSINVKGVPAVMELSDLPLSNYQAVVPNCWGNLKFC